MVMGTQGIPQTTTNYPKNYTGLKFDKTARFLFCANDMGVAVASCSVESFAVEDLYTANTPATRYSYEFLGGFNRIDIFLLEYSQRYFLAVLIAAYSFAQKTGTTIKNNVKSLLGPAKFGI